MKWTTWQSPPEPIRVETWRGDEDLLAQTRSGAALPVGELTVRRYCGLEGEFTPLAKLYGGAPLLARVTTERGGVYFCAATAAPSDASLGTDGVALYVAVQRALAAGAAELAQARQLAAGDTFPAASEPWQQLAGSAEALSTEYPFHAGVYSADEQIARRESRRSGGPPRDLERRPCGRAVSRARFRPRRRSGRQHAVAGPRGLAGVPRPRWLWRWWPKPASVCRGRLDRREARHERHPVAHLPGLAVDGRRRPSWLGSPSPR